MNIQRNTIQRQIILDALRNLNTHPSVDEIYEAINCEHPSISKSTIYRNLRQLACAGFIRQVIMPDGLERYDGTIRMHYHFRCKRCGTIFDVDIPYLEEINHDVQSRYDFVVDEHDVVFSGVCQNCLRNESVKKEVM